ncbi:hypothetical protein Kpol_1020p50 [Vanderwaltozyma polyspora DSM 70294]|uniref:Uncharacterized protein n=1 Tax=Vanderwaltozyma polyspora (strain ATCC 22028 / DSM 70294 / BCRC 21397 / CBS 2163 / NBRC 10782 / NRRL Y-8283 / UCD 57-17) TaxID=436907 RepID=A7TLF9_VANPO|nr:uncharacterized protein Kpol_1020p50 [Vanderwaltozyma polyspora DSM 70294]EDO16940.1 hypothetical protein Kpol_1020p50 [Vanderwaltozyma polyspora DSM 70294]
MLMDQIKCYLDKYLPGISSRVRFEPLYEIHLPSLVLGITFTTVLGPLLHAVIGSVLSSLVTLLKYLIIIGTVVASIVVATSRNKNIKEIENDDRVIRDDPKITKGKLESRDELVTFAINSYNETTHNQLQQDTSFDNTIQKISKDFNKEPRKEDFEKLKYYDIPIVKSRRDRSGQIVDSGNPYENFINLAENK